MHQFDGFQQTCGGPVQSMVYTSLRRRSRVVTESPPGESEPKRRSRRQTGMYIPVEHDPVSTKTQKRGPAALGRSLWPLFVL